MITMKKNTGFSLIEVMISALILSISFLGIMGLQISSLKGTQESFGKQQAMNFTNSFIERMRTNPAAVKSKDYVVDSDKFSCATAYPSCTANECTPSEISTIDKLNIICGTQLGQEISSGGIKGASSLLNGSLRIACLPSNPAVGILKDCASGDIEITTSWRERASSKMQSPDERSMTIQTRITYE